jgi:hypothetical protein
MHMRDAVAGGPGDNYSFIWNLWWMRHVLATPGLAYFHTAYLFYPFGTTIANHPHTALPALVAATLLAPASVVTAQNVLLLAFVFVNLASMYALVWDVTRHRRAAVFAAVLFGLSPYVAAHMLGHFDLVAAWVLPLFALCARRALTTGSIAWTVAAGLVAVATAYTTYYYVVYLFFFLGVYGFARLDWTPFRWSRRTPTAASRLARVALGVLGAALSAIAVWVLATGGSTVSIGDVAIAVHTPQNALTGIWICAIAFALTRWRPTLASTPPRRERARAVAVLVMRIAGVFAIGAAPLLWHAAALVVRGAYVSQQYGWRSVPHGIDLLAPLLGHPLHPLMSSFSRPAYAALGQNAVEAIAWIGIAPMALLLSVRRRRAADGSAGDERAWRIVALAFAVFALGPFLTIGGFDTGLKLPEILMRYVPLAADARMPGRAIVGVYLAIGVLISGALASARGRLGHASVQWLLIGAVVFEYWTAPIPLTSLDRPAVYATLAAAPPGAVCEVPMGIGDGLSTGAGSQERRVLYYATLHEHPLVGGFIGRMPSDAMERYRDNPSTATLLRLSESDQTIEQTGSAGMRLPCEYIVVDRNSSSALLREYVESLPVERLESDERRDLYKLR